MKRSVIWPILLVLFVAVPAAGHESRPGYLEFTEISPERYDILWKQPARGEMILRMDPVLPEACTQAGAERKQMAPGALMTRATVDCEGGLRGKTVRIAGLESTLTDVMIRVYHEDGSEETHLLRPTSTSVTISLAPSRASVSAVT